MSTKEDLKKVAGPDNMAKPSASKTNGGAALDNMGNLTSAIAGPAKPKKKRGPRKSKRNRRQSFAALSEATETAAEEETPLERPSILDVPNPRSSTQQASLYRIRGGNRSNTSLESEALLDHRDHPRPRKKSMSQSYQRGSQFARGHRPWESLAPGQSPTSASKSRLSRPANLADSDDDNVDPTDRTPLLGAHSNRSKPDLSRNNSFNNYAQRSRRASIHSKDSPRIRPGSNKYDKDEEEDYDVNNPPSMPGSPKLGSLDDLMITDLTRSDSDRDRDRDVLINIDNEDDDGDEWRMGGSSPDAPRRRPTAAELAERDVCFPADDQLTEIDEMEGQQSRASSRQIRRRRSRRWPDLGILEDWSREEKEERTAQEVQRVKKISEPLVVGGRLRPKQKPWHAEQDDAPFRFTYFNETLDTTIHARTISDLCQDGQTFSDLFLPEPPELSDESEDSENDEDVLERPAHNDQREHSIAASETNTLSRLHTRVQQGSGVKSPPGSRVRTGTSTPELSGSRTATPKLGRRAKRYGPRPTFWLDVLKPTEVEMKVLTKAFGIHQLTTEDILMEEPREKVELFQSYYFVNYRSFEQDKDNSEYMEPVNIYVVVFREGVITFHHSMTPHPANVRRRIRQLNDYMSPTADWISYAIIDDVTDAYAPLVQIIEDEVDDIDDEILYMHQAPVEPAAKDKKIKDAANQADAGAAKADGEKTAGEQGGDMLRRVGECRKKVMGLYRLLGNKADVIKGFAKRCNEHWEVAPRSEIGLYLGDIQDHIVTMTGNLSHYEKYVVDELSNTADFHSLLSRAHSNYLAQINIRMNERAEQTADVLGKLTVLGTIVLPMNIVTGMWGMNVWVPGQGKENDLVWFWSITAGLFAFGATCYFVAKRVYGIV